MPAVKLEGVKGGEGGFSVSMIITWANQSFPHLRCQKGFLSDDKKEIWGTELSRTVRSDWLGITWFVMLISGQACARTLYASSSGRSTDNFLISSMYPQVTPHWSHSCSLLTMSLRIRGARCTLLMTRCGSICGSDCYVATWGGEGMATNSRRIFRAISMLLWAMSKALFTSCWE